MVDPEADQDQVLEVASGLGNGLRESGRYADAAKMQRDVLNQRREIHADDPAHPELLRARHNAAIDLRVCGDYAAALEMDQETLSLRSDRLTPDHYQTLLTQSSVAGDLRAMGRYAEAVALQERTYLSTLDALGPTSTYTFAAMIQLAICRRRAGQHQAAYDIATDVYQHCVDRYGENHPVTIAAATNLAGECRTLGMLDEGLGYATRAVASAQVLYPETHVYRAACEANQATLLRALVVAGAPPQDERTPEEVLAEVLRTDLASVAVLSDALGADHAYTLAVVVNVASDHAALGDYESAVAVGRRAYERLSATRGPEHPHTVAACVNLAADLEHVDAGEAAQRRAWLEGLLNGDEAYRYPDLSEDGIESRVICDLDLPMW
jgi:tetratricopeptide (TPR) repeat protein